MTNYPTGDFQNEVLRAILVKNGMSYVTEINSYLCNKLSRELLTPQVQVALKRLEQRQLVVLLREEKSDKGGRPRKIFGLTEAGRQMISTLKPSAETSQPVQEEPSGAQIN